MDRVQVDNPLAGRRVGAANLAPLGNTFQRVRIPEPVPDTSLQELANGLGQLNQGLTNHFSQELERQDTEAEQEGRAAFLENQMSFQQMVDAGVIEPGQNPHFRRGVNGAHLRSLSERFGSQLRLAHASSDVAHSDDPAALGAFMAEFHDNFMRENNFDGFDDGEIAEFYADRAANQMSQLQQRHTEQRIVAIQEEAVEVIGVETNALIDTFLEEEGGDLGLLGEALGEIVDRNNPGSNVFNGLSQREANDALVDAVILRATEQNDASILDVLSEIPTNGSNIGSITRYREDITAARVAIARERRSQEAHENALYDRNTRLARENVIQEGLELLSRGGESAEEFQSFLSRATALGYGQQAEQLRGIMMSRLRDGNTVFEDPADLATLRERIIESPESWPSIVANAVEDGLIGESGVQQLSQFGQLNIESNVFTSTGYVGTLRDIRRMMGGDANLDFTEERELLITRSQDVFQDEIAEWAENHHRETGSFPQTVPRAVLREARRVALEEGQIENLGVLTGQEPAADPENPYEQPGMSQ